MFLSHNDVSLSSTLPLSPKAMKKMFPGKDKVSSGILITIKFQQISPLALSPSHDMMYVSPPSFSVSCSVGSIRTGLLFSERVLVRGDSEQILIK